MFWILKGFEDGEVLCAAWCATTNNSRTPKSLDVGVEPQQNKGSILQKDRLFTCELGAVSNATQVCYIIAFSRDRLAQAPVHQQHWTGHDGSHPVDPSLEKDGSILCFR